MGTLYIVSTPIGNLEDITFRALRVLREAALVAAEDTRHSGRLLHHFQIDKPLVSLHEHNEEARVSGLLSALARGEDVALISDAGTPLLSDPGYPLVRATIAAGHPVVAIPGASALLAALVSSGLPTHRFLFVGFPPRKASQLRELAQSIAAEPGTLVFYESPGRVQALLVGLCDALGPERPVVIARELTKLHETLWRGPLGEASTAFAVAPLGEVVVLVGGASAAAIAPVGEDVAYTLRGLLAGGMTTAEAARLVASLADLPRRQVYRLALDLQRAAETVGQS